MNKGAILVEKETTELKQKLNNNMPLWDTSVSSTYINSVNQMKFSALPEAALKLEACPHAMEKQPIL